MKGIELILTLNYFVFDDKWYLQIKGVAMGTKATIILAILTVGYLLGGTPIDWDMGCAIF